MPITAAQRELRRNHLGSSDMAAVLGLDPRRNAYDVWLDKTGKLEDQQENEAMIAGTMFEDGVLQYAEKELGKLTRNQYRSAKDRGIPLGANIDALLVQTGEPIEAKTAGLYGPLTEIWGEARTDQVPDRVIIQAQVHMICAASELCHIAAFLGGRGFQLFAVPRDEEVVDVVSTRAAEFWTKHVLADIPPDNLLPHAGFIKRVRREPDAIVEIDSKLISEWQEAKAAAKIANELAEEKQTAILTALGDAEAGQCELGQFTYLEQSRSEYIVKATKYRVARFKKNK